MRWRIGSNGRPAPVPAPRLASTAVVSCNKVNYVLISQLDGKHRELEREKRFQNRLKLKRQTQSRESIIAAIRRTCTLLMLQIDGLL